MIVSNRIFGTIEKMSDLKTYQVGVIEAAAHRALRQHKDALLKNYNLTGVEWYTVGTVSDAGDAGVRATDLAKALGTTMGFLTKTVTMLEAKGYLFRRANPEDARSTYICFNDEKRAMVDEIEEALRERLRTSIYSLITPEELQVYIHSLDKFSDL